MAKRKTRFDLITILQIILIASFFIFFMYNFFKTHKSMMKEFKEKNNIIEGFLSDKNKIDEGESKLLKKLNDAKKEVLDEVKRKK